MTSDRTKKLGKLGEKYFSLLCSQEDITVISSTEDDVMGWDFFVEFPIENILGQPRDLAPTPIKCLVQVKATDSRQKRRNLKVSNLEKLVKVHMLAFYCFLHFDGQNTPQATYLVHVDNEITYKTLKRIRELDNKRESNRLNKHKILITYDEENIIDLNRDDVLKKFIRKYIPTTLESYLQSKSEYQQKIGFEDGYGDLRVTFEGQANLKKLIDLTLGIGDVVTIKNAEYHDKRFGLLSPESKFPQIVSGEISLKPNKIPVTLKFKKHPFDLGVELDAHMYSTPFKLYEMEGLNRFRLKSELLEIISGVKLTDDNNLETSAKFFFEPLEKRVRLDILKKYMSLIKLFQENSCSLILEVQLSDFPAVMKLNLTGQTSSFEDYSDFFRVIEQLSFICQSFRLSENKINLQPVDLVHSAPDIKLMYDLLNYAPYKVSFSGEAEGFNIVDKNCYAKACGFKLGTITFIFYVAFVGKIIEVEGNQYELSTDEVIRGNTIIKENHMISEELIDKGLEKFMQDLENMNLSPFRINQ